MANLVPNLRQKFFDSGNLPLVAGKIYSYAAGTTTPLATYTDATGSTPNTNPVILDANGEADIWISASGYKFVIKDSADVTIKTVDGVFTIDNGGVSTTKLADGSVTTVKIAANAVTTAKIGPGEVQTANLADLNVTTGKINDSAVSTAKIATGAITPTKLGSTIYSQVFTERNKLINGDMAIAQRGTSFAPAVSTNYTLDRWKYFKAGAAAFTVARDSDCPTFAESGFSFTGSMKLTCTTVDVSIAAGDIVEIGQPIEASFCRDLIKKATVLSVWIKSSRTGVMGVTLKNGITGNAIGTPTRSIIKEITINLANTWEKKEIPVIAPTDGTWATGDSVTGIYVGFVLVAGTTFQTTKDVWQNGDYSGSSGMANFADANTNVVFITGARFEAGDIARQYESRHPAIEDTLCRRYYEKIPYGFRGHNPNVVSVSAIGGYIGWNVAKTTSIGVSFVSGTVTKCNNVFISNGSTGLNCGADFTATGVGPAYFDGIATVDSEIAT